jgi:hypothetical protein
MRLGTWILFLHLPLLLVVLSVYGWTDSAFGRTFPGGFKGHRDGTR